MSTVVKGKNDLYTWCIENNQQDILEDWDAEQNFIAPCNISRASNKVFSWRCSKCKQRWNASPNSRTRPNGTGCPFCAGKKVIVGKNDFATIFPEIASEWNYELNDKKPEEYSVSSAQIVWWRGKCHHEWKDSISHRTIRKSGCPFCYNQMRTSFPEQAVYYYVVKYYPDAINGDRTILNGKELDIFIPSLNVAIEYDGQAWHNDKEKDEQKNILCEKQKIILYRIRERECWFWSESKYLKLIPCSAHDSTDINNAISCLLISLGRCTFPDVDITRDEIAIREQFITKKQEKSLSALYPEIAKEWHIEKNGSITPEMVTVKSAMLAWWIDSQGHEWKAKVYSRTKGSGCPYCSNPARKLLPGFNDFATKHPDIAMEWDAEKNGIFPSNVLYGSSRKYWWKCSKCEISFLASPANRHNGTGCPVCAIERTSTSKYKSVKNIDTGEIFKSMKDACLKYNLVSANLTKCCQGERNTCGGFRWKFIE